MYLVPAREAPLREGSCGCGRHVDVLWDADRQPVDSRRPDVPPTATNLQTVNLPRQNWGRPKAANDNPDGRQRPRGHGRLPRPLGASAQLNPSIQPHP